MINPNLRMWISKSIHLLQRALLVILTDQVLPLAKRLGQVEHGRFPESNTSAAVDGDKSVVAHVSHHHPHVGSPQSSIVPLIEYVRVSNSVHWKQTDLHEDFADWIDVWKRSEEQSFILINTLFCSDIIYNIIICECNILDSNVNQ